MLISAIAKGHPGPSAVGSLYSNFNETTNSSTEAACPLVNEMANCRPAARHVKNVAAKSSSASHHGFVLGLRGCQAGTAAESSSAAALISASSVACGGNCFSLFTKLGCGSFFRGEPQESSGDYCSPSPCSSLPGLKRTAFPGGIFTSSPVRGLRPIPVFLGFTVNTPKRRSSMRWLRPMPFFSDSKTVSTACSAFTRLTFAPSSLPNTALTMSSLIKRSSAITCRSFAAPLLETPRPSGTSARHPLTLAQFRWQMLESARPGCQGCTARTTLALLHATQIYLRTIPDPITDSGIAPQPVRRTDVGQ